MIDDHAQGTATDLDSNLVRSSFYSQLVGILCQKDSPIPPIPPEAMVPLSVVPPQEWARWALLRAKLSESFVRSQFSSIQSCLH